MLRRRRLVAYACVSWLAGCAMTPERLPDLDRRFYANLESPVQQKAFLELDENERHAFLQRSGLWQRWLALPEAQREAAARGQVEIGFDEFAVRMAWGPPADTRDRDRNGQPALIHTYIRCSSGPKRGRYVRTNLECDGTSDESMVAIQNGVVTEIRYGT